MVGELYEELRMSLSFLDWPAAYIAVHLIKVNKYILSKLQIWGVN